jgi:hypothetical protein
MYRIALIANSGELFVNTAKLSKSLKSYEVTIGECTCYKSTCDCIKTIVLPKDAVKEIVEFDSTVPPNIDIPCKECEHKDLRVFETPCINCSVLGINTGTSYYRRKRW